MKNLLVLTLIVLIAGSGPALAGLPLDPDRATVNNTLVRVSVKILLDGERIPYDPDDTGWVPNRGHILDILANTYDKGNQVLTYTKQDVRLDLVEVIELLGFSSWNSGNDCESLHSDLDTQAKLKPTKYAYREDAVNIYIIACSDPFGGMASYPESKPGHGDIIIMKANYSDATLLHETGHHFGLRHTHETLPNYVAVALNCDEYYPEGFQRFYLEPGDEDEEDMLASTLLDHPCWDIHDMSRWHYGINFDALRSRNNKKRVRDSYHNIMSYHPDRMRMTREQLDRLLNTATTNEPSVLAEETQRATSVSPHLGLEGQAQWRWELEGEFLGSWVAVEGDTDWISWLEFRREQLGPPSRQLGPDSPNVYLFANVDSSATTEWSGYALKFIPSIYSDSLTGVPETNYDSATGQPLGKTGYSLTYTARMTHENTIVVRIAVFSNDAYWEPFYERKVVLARPTAYQIRMRILPGT